MSRWRHWPAALLLVAGTVLIAQRTWWSIAIGGVVQLLSVAAQLDVVGEAWMSRVQGRAFSTMRVAPDLDDRGRLVLACLRCGWSGRAGTPATVGDLIDAAVAHHLAVHYHPRRPPDDIHLPTPPDGS